MSTTQAEAPKITARDMGRKWDREVRDIVFHLVNHHGIQFRKMDGDHMLLYPPDGVTRPFKIAAKRTPALTAQFLREQFMADYELADLDGNVPEPRYGTREEPVDESATEVVEAAERPTSASSQGSGTDPVAAVRLLATTLGVSLGDEEETLLLMQQVEDLQTALNQAVEERDEKIARINTLEQANRTLQAQVQTRREAIHEAIIALEAVT